MSECREVIYSENYFDLISEYANVEVDEEVELICEQRISDRFSGVYVNVNELTNGMLQGYSYSAIPNLYGLMDINAIDSTNAERLSQFPGLELKGESVIVGFVDTGIDIYNDLFKNGSGGTRILSIWDQTIRDGTPPANFDFGEEYNTKEINEMIRDRIDSSAASIVRDEREAGISKNESTTERDSNGIKRYVGDLDGHGTAIAAIACGNEKTEFGFSGVATKSDIVVVKLKEAKNNLKEYYVVNDDIKAFAENDIMMGISYLLSVAKREKKPIVIMLGIGTSMGDHNGGSPLSQYLDEISARIGVCVVVCGGNEGIYRLHYAGKVTENNPVDMEIRVGENNSGFTLEIWGESPDIFSVGFISPLGQVIERIPARVGVSEVILFLLEQTEISVDYKIVESASGEELIFIRIKNPTEGIWTVRVYGSNIIGGNFNSWLPLRQFVGEDTYFLQSVPDTTITEPGNAENVITVAAYNYENNAIMLESGRGYTVNGRIKPELASPGVNVLVPISGSKGNEFERRSGTSIATAIAAGICALYLEWGIVRQNDMYIRTTYIKSYLIRGAKRLDGVNYPNRQAGYGYIDALNSFTILITS
jgi:subtilisin family serine protease